MGRLLSSSATTRSTKVAYMLVLGSDMTTYPDLRSLSTILSYRALIAAIPNDNRRMMC